ncbi:MAG TPA: hypothetical protein VF550_19905 [Polyangia bacterium]
MRSVHRDLLIGSALLITTALGCGGTSSNPDAATLDSAELGVLPPYCTNSPGLAGGTDLSGTWIMRLEGAQSVVAPIVGTVNTKSVFYILATLSQNGTEVVANGRYCDRIEKDPPTNIVQVIIPPAWAHTEKTVTRAGTFAPASDGIWELKFDHLVEFAGVVPGSDPLPTVVNDEVIDEDGDGHPGITVSISGQSLSGNLYSVQEQMTSITAIVVGQNRVEGALLYSSLQNVLSSEPSNLAALYPHSDIPASDSVLCHSRFAMVRIASSDSADGGAIDTAALDAGESSVGGATTCAWVRANESILFPQ